MNISLDWRPERIERGECFRSVVVYQKARDEVARMVHTEPSATTIHSLLQALLEEGGEFHLYPDRQKLGPGEEFVFAARALCERVEMKVLFYELKQEVLPDLLDLVNHSVAGSEWLSVGGNDSLWVN